MDGRNRKVLVSTDLGWPNSLLIDHATNTLYWTDARKKTIEACDLSGQHRRQVLTGLSHPYGITLLDSYLYWTDWETKSLQWDVALNVPGVDFHWGRQRFYYTDVYLDVIRSVDARNVSNVATLVSNNLTTPDGLAVDWLVDNLYWTDAGRNVLEVSRLDGSSRKIVIGNGLDEPRAVAVFPQRGLLYWTDWGQSHKIERSFMDGSHRVAIVTSELGWPNGLAIDFTGPMLNWTGSKRRI